MTDSRPSAQGRTTAFDWLAAYGATAILVSGVVAAVSTVFLLLTFATQASTIMEPAAELTPLDRAANGLMGLAVVLAVPAAFRLHQSWRSRAPVPSRVALAVGVVSLLADGLLLLVLAGGLFNSDDVGVLSIVPFGGIGLWIFLVSASEADPALRGALRWVGLIIGVGYTLLVIGFYGGGGSAAVSDPEVVLESPLLLVGAMAGLLASQIGYPIWAIWLGRRLRADRGPDSISTTR